jgi:hypothetical protein
MYGKASAASFSRLFTNLTDKYVHTVRDAPTSWFVAHILRIGHPVMCIPSRGSDTEFDWTQDLLFVVLAVLDLRQVLP